MKRSAKLILGAVALWAVLLALLTAAESGQPDATIRSFWDAAWFSLITMTTVGYGDLSPVTVPGRLLGGIFALCSIGILTALIGIGLRLIGGEFIPRLRLRLGRKRHWYAFDRDTPDAAALASALRREAPGCLLIFPPCEDALTSGSDVVRLDADAEALAQIRGEKEGLSLFFMGAEPWENYTRALAAAENGCESYCMGDLNAEKLPPALQLFSPREAMSRQYWKEHPLKRNERCIVLIGCGEAGSALLERAVLTNVFEPGRTVYYHVFGDTAGFAILHPEIVKALSDPAAEEDRLIFHREAWTDARELLAEADRIIFACDDDQENLTESEKLHSWFPVSAAIHVRLIEPVPGLASFGGRSESIRPEFVMKDAVNRQARLLNEIYNESSPTPTLWNDLTPFLRQSNIAAADHLIVKARYLLGEEDLIELTNDVCRRAGERFASIYEQQADLLQEMEHRRWMRFHQMYNWQFAPVRDNAHRRHPMLVPYEDLPPEEQKKDAYAWEMLGRLAAK